jgi:hypothetical protein
MERVLAERAEDVAELDCIREITNQESGNFNMERDFLFGVGAGSHMYE